MIPGVFTGLTVTSAPLDPAVYELGLAPANTPTAAIVGNAALPTNGKLSADATITVTADGGTATPITITAASTTGNTNQNQLLTQVTTALAPLNATLTAANRKPIVVTLTSGGRPVLRHFRLWQYAVDQCATPRRRMAWAWRRRDRSRQARPRSTSRPPPARSRLTTS